MDYAASLTEAQQQLLAQYQQHLQQQQQQQQQQPQQQQQQATQAYDPSQVQAYDPTSQAYYPYPQQYQNSAAHHQHQQPYPYYPDYGNSAATAAAAASNAYQQTDSSSQPQDLSAAGAQQYYPQDQQGSYSASSGLNPAAAAAVAALSQLTQFAGTMDAAERAVAEQQWNNGGAGQVAPQQNPPQHGGAPVHPPAASRMLKYAIFPLGKLIWEPWSYHPWIPRHVGFSLCCCVLRQNRGFKNPLIILSDERSSSNGLEGF